MIEAEDILRLDLELNFMDSYAWMENNNIDFSAIELVVNSAYNAMAEKLFVIGAQNYNQIFSETIANAFVFGWEAFKQYGERK